MPKFPLPPGVDALRAIAPAIATLRAGTTLARIYFTAGRYPTRWNALRHYGPAGARFDHHLDDADGGPRVQERGILYCARDAQTCFAEVFQEVRLIHRTRRAPWLAVFKLERDVALLDLTGAFATRIGASMAISTGPRSRARLWARELYEAYPQAHGILYGSSMNGNAPAVALTERALAVRCLPAHPEFNRALADDTLVDVQKHVARALGYALV